MKRKILLGTLLLSTACAFGQQQIGNSDFESWESVSGGTEPTNWSSFLTAQGSLSGQADVQVEASTDVRPGSSGTQSARIWSREIFTIIANGNLTLGRVNMGSIVPSGADNYNISLTSDTDFSEELTDTPDSIVFWAKFIPASGTPNARMKATIHDAYDYRDPEDANSSSHVVATAVLNYPPTGGVWQRFSVPFDYSGPASTAQYILITFTTNQSPGGGSGNDQVWIDDVELIYNPTVGTQQISNDIAQVGVKAIGNSLHFSGIEHSKGEFVVYNLMGGVVKKGSLTSQTAFNEKSGVYLISIQTEEGTVTKRIYKN